MRPRQRCSPSDTSPPCRSCSRFSCIPRAWWASSALFAYVEVGTFFTTASLGEFIIVGFVLYALGLVMPFASLLWVMMIKLFMGGDIYKNNVTPGVYPKWSRMHLRIWCIGRLENIVLLSLRRCIAARRSWHSCCGSSARRWATTFSARTMLTSPGPWT